MRRVERLDQGKTETGLRRSKHEKTPSWTPRARRLNLDEAMRYRMSSTSIWHEGWMENLSQTGVRFRGPQSLPARTLIDMVFEMPEEISGQKNRNVVCQGRVIRSAEQASVTTKDSDPYPEIHLHRLAASIVDYKFVR